MDQQHSQNTPDRIDLQDQGACERWAKKLDVTQQQMREAVQAVGNNPSDVEMHLKGVRSTTNEDRTERAMAGDKAR